MSTSYSKSKFGQILSGKNKNKKLKRGIYDVEDVKWEYTSLKAVSPRDLYYGGSLLISGVG